MQTADPSSDLVNTLTSAFFNFGPFFLAIFVQFFVIAKARAWYQEVCVRQQPAASHEEQETYRYYFLGSIVASLAIFGVAVWAWWALNITGDHQYRFEIDGLSETQTLSAVDTNATYVQDVWSYKSSPPFHNVSFVIVSDHPIRKGEVFALRYNVVPTTPAPASAGDSQSLSGGSITADLQVTYSGHHDDKFRIAVKDGQPALSAMATGNASVAQRHFASLAPRPTRDSSR